ncbi:MAG: DNA-binding protein [Candidatus Sericytochromatia bacterium]|nr:DNA-binding protein [Candidatus Tanganyikabacteria bacterium]
MDRVFLDANVLLLAAYRSDAGLRRLWDLEGAALVTSLHAAEEARRNLDHAQQRADLENLLSKVSVVFTTPPDRPIPEGDPLPDKDRPIMLAAIEAGSTHLITGDFRHFGRLFGTTVEGASVLPPSEYLRLRERPSVGDSP